MPRIYLPITEIKNNRISITGEKARYLNSILRCRKGDDLIIFDGKGNCYRTNVIEVDKREVVTELEEKYPCNTESHINITLVQGILKGEKMDMVIQKATELGVREIIPAITERSQLRQTRKAVRWRKIAEEASRQSGRSMIPIVHDPIEFKKLFSKQTAINNPPQLPLTKGEVKWGGFIFYEEGGMKLSEAFASLVPYPSSFFVVIGPEGGFIKEEINLAKEEGLVVTSFGERILRAETAAVAAVTLVQFILGDMC